MTERKDNIIPFPRRIEYKGIQSEGVFTLNAEHLSQIMVSGASILIWFGEHEETDAFDMKVDFLSEDDAEISCQELLKEYKKMKMKGLL